MAADINFSDQHFFGNLRLKFLQAKNSLIGSDAVNVGAGKAAGYRIEYIKVIAGFKDVLDFGKFKNSAFSCHK